MKQMLIALVMILMIAGCGPAAAPEPIIVPTATADPCADDLARFVVYADGVVPRMRAAYDAIAAKSPLTDPVAMNAYLEMMELAKDVRLFNVTSCTEDQIAKVQAAANALSAFGEKHLLLQGGWDAEQSAALNALLDVEVELASLKSD